MSRDGRPDHRRDSDMAARLAAGMLAASAVSVEVFLRRNFGSRYLGLQALGVPLLVGFHCYLFRDGNCAPFKPFLLAYLAALVLHRLGRLRRWCQGQPEGHSRYAGDSWVPAVIPWLSDATAKWLVEPALVFAAAGAALPYSKPFAAYLLLAGVSLRALDAAGAVWRREQDRDLNDLVIEQESAAERFRRLRGERW
jgi:hypothetical protein